MGSVIDEYVFDTRLTPGIALKIYCRVLLGVHRFVRLVVPELDKRKPLSWKTVPQTWTFIPLVLFMAYLARRPNTHLIRLLLLPTVIVVTMHCCWSQWWPAPGMSVYNWGGGEPVVPKLFILEGFCTLPLFIIRSLTPYFS
jgi:hypothetical protein